MLKTQSAAMKMLLTFDAPDATLALVGGKGANLAKLACAGFPVPGGFLITTDAYRAFLAENDLQPGILETVSRIDNSDPAALEHASAQIRARFAAGVLPSTLAQELCAAYKALGSPPVAVRSSATAEDLPDLSFAGQQDTYLNITGESALLAAVINCWGSLWTARAIGYRSRNHIAHDDVALAVVIQEMVQSEASGVLFTANPLTGKRTEIVIDATLGLGEALVSGQVEPDQYIVDMTQSRILSKTLGAKALAIHGLPEGGTTTVHKEASSQQAIGDAVILDLAHLGQRVANLYGAPQDIEWAWTRDRLYLLQARPITSLFPVPPGVAAEPLEIFLSLSAVQGVLDPLTPLGRDALTITIVGGLGGAFGLSNTLQSRTVFYTAGERLWARVTPLVNNRIGRKVIQAFAGIADPGIQQALREVLAEPGGTTPGLPRPSTILHIAHLVRRVLPKMLHSLLWPEQNRMAIEQQIEREVEQFAAQAAAAHTLSTQLALLEDDMLPRITRIFPEVLARVAPGMLMLNRILALADQTWAGNQTQQQPALEITRGLPHNVTTEMDLALWATAQQIGGDAKARDYLLRHDAATLAQNYLDGCLPAAAQSAVGAFLRRYGLRGVAEIDLGRARWRDNPVQIMQTLQSYLRIDDAQAPSAVFHRGELAARQIIVDLQDAVRSKPRGASQAWLVGWMAQRFRALAGLRESPKFFMIRLLGIVRQALLQSGRELAQRGVIAQRDDLFFLHIGELKGLAAGYAIDWKALVAARRESYQREQLRRQVPRLLLSDGRAFYRGASTASPARAGVLVGAPVSPGVVEGTVRVVFDPHTTQLAPGEILVCPGTDPAWTPLFLAAGGLVMEVGGLMTHGSVVAREYGIPAVVGVHEATLHLKTGQRVRVDGSSGEIVLLNDANDPH